MLLKITLFVLLSLIQIADVETPSGGVEVTERYTLRVNSSGSYYKPKVNALAVSPDGKQVAIATSRELFLARSSDCEIELRVDYSPFAIAYSNDSRQLFTISRRSSKMFRVAPTIEIPCSFSRPQGYFGMKLEEKGGKLVTVAVEPGGPAAKSGIPQGAEVVGFSEGSGTAIESVVGDSLGEVLKKLEGPAKTTANFAFIPRGKINETNATLTRMLIKPSGGYGFLPTPDVAESVANYMRNDYHEFRNSRSGNYVSSIRCEQIENHRGAMATSKDGEWFAFLAEYKDPETATLSVRQRAKTTNGDQPRLVKGPAANRVGYKQGARRIHGAEIYNVRTQELVASFPVGTDVSNRSGKFFIGVQLDPTKNQMVVGTSSTIHVYDTETGERTSTIRPMASDDTVYYTSLAMARKFAAIGDKLGVVRIVNLETKQLVKTILSREKGIVTHVDLSKDAKTLTYHCEGVVHIVHLKMGE